MGLIKTGLKAAVAVKVAHVVHDRIERRQQAQWAAGGHPTEMSSPTGAPQAAAPVPHVAPAVPAEPPPVTDMLAQLTQLGELKAAGVLTEAEFQTQKARILGG
jgi:Short C-terminal domain